MTVNHARTWSATLIALVALMGSACAVQPSNPQVLIYGASGRIGAAITEEALLRGYAVTAVTRNRSRLEHLADRVSIVESNILDQEHAQDLISDFSTVIVSIGGPPKSQDPARYIAATSASALIDVLSSLGSKGPRIIFVGNLFTLKYENDKTLLELGRVAASDKNYAMYYGHQLALDAFRASNGVRWTVASPPNGFRLKGRTGNIRWGADTLIRDADGSPSTISLEDYAFAIFEEVQDANYIGSRFTVAR